MYSGISGAVMILDLFVGVVYYQRLRHMIADKSQVRSSGPVHQLTMQPVKGRKRHGGIRLGEMERDSILSHGAVFVLQDRLLECSDMHSGTFSQKRGLLGSHTLIESNVLRSESVQNDRETYAIGLHRRRQLEQPQQVKMPYVFRLVHLIARYSLPHLGRYLVEEAAGMNVTISLRLM